MKNNTGERLFIIAALAVLAGAVLVMENVVWAKYVFICGAVYYAIYRVLNLYKGKDFRYKRLNRIHLFNVVLLLGGAYIMYKGENTWVVLLLLMALLELYVSFRTSIYRKRDAEKTKEGEK